MIPVVQVQIVLLHYELKKIVALFISKKLSPELKDCAGKTAVDWWK